MPDPETHEAYVARRVGELKQLEGAAYVEAARWRNDPNISHLGWGRRMKNGQITDELAVIFLSGKRPRPMANCSCSAPSAFQLRSTAALQPMSSR